MRIRWTSLVAATAVALALAACAPADEGSSNPTTAAPTTAATTQTTAALATLTPGTLTIGTSEPAYEPWVVDDDPTNQKGYESAVAYAVAEQLGFAPDDVVWVRDTFEQIIAPGTKDLDFAINQVSITDERKASLDFSSSYYDTAQAVVTLSTSPAASAKTLTDLKAVKIGATVGTTSLTAAQQTIAPTGDVQVFNDNDQLVQALQAGLVDAIVLDLPTALYVGGVELTGGVIVGQLADSAGGDSFGLVLDKGSSLTPAVTAAVDALREDGTLADLQAQWLTDAAGAPVLK